jgi:hypothetical protein
MGLAKKLSNAASCEGLKAKKLRMHFIVPITINIPNV